MFLVVAIIVLVCLALLASHYWQQLFNQESALGNAPFSRWLWVGLVLPSLGWLFLNLGVLRSLPPIIPEIAIAQSNGLGWFGPFTELTGPGLLIIGSFWTAVTFAELVTLIAVRTESRAEFALTGGVIGLLALPIAWICCAGGGICWAGLAALCWLLPVTHCTSWLAGVPKAVPMYARAVARMKLGKYRDAEKEVIQQLEKREDDFEGWMMLAELYATQFGDLVEADRVVRSVCDQPNITPLQISLALRRLADWHLKLADNPIAARRALAEISRRLPDSHFATMAQVQSRQLPASREEYLAQKKPKIIRLPALTGELEAPLEKAGPSLSRSDALSLVHECVERLKRDPNEIGSREKLATLFTEQLNKPELGIEQLELLLGMTAPEAKKAEWLSLLAAWQFRHRQDRAAAKRVLEQLIHEHPQSVQGFAAQRWLNLLEMEERLRPVPAERFG